MPIQRPSEREQRPSALEVFTDREELIADFERNLEHKKPEEYRVLVFYGDGGIGKTTLLQKLEQLHRQRCPQALIGRLDLAGADTTPPDLLLYRLRRLFPTIPFPSFSLALAEYGRRFHPEQVYGSDRKELLQGAGPYADVLAGGLEVLGQLSGVGLAVSTMKAAATAQRQLSDWVQRRAEPWLQHSQSLSEEQLLDQLPRQWARDFRQALSSQLDQGWDDAITYSGPPPLIAFDTYETLWHSGMGRSGRRREPRERWLVDLVSELPEVLWVIGGRDRLSWEGYDKAWGKACEQHLVGQLSDERRLEKPQEPTLQFFVADLGSKRIEAGSHNYVVCITHAPHHVGKGFALEGCSVCQGGDVLADLLRVVVVFLKLDPFGFLGQSAEFVHQADQKSDGPPHSQDSGSSGASSRSSGASSSESLMSSNSSIAGSS